MVGKWKKKQSEKKTIKTKLGKNVKMKTKTHVKHLRWIWCAMKSFGTQELEIPTPEFQTWNVQILRAMFHLLKSLPLAIILNRFECRHRKILLGNWLCPQQHSAHSALGVVYIHKCFGLLCKFEVLCMLCMFEVLSKILKKIFSYCQCSFIFHFKITADKSLNFYTAVKYKKFYRYYNLIQKYIATIFINDT